MSMTVPHRILIAPSGFKESLDAETVARAIGAGVRRVLPGVHIDLVPIPDGGEGTAAIVARTTGGDLVPARVTGPVGQTVTARWARLGGTGANTAVVEMAAAAGLRLVPRGDRDPGATTTRGVGELVLAALDDGMRTIIIGCGDSGTSDGGAGALAALGVVLRDEDGAELPDGGRHLTRLRSLDFSGLDPRLADTELVLACNITNVLCGDHGVARVFGPQKGASPEQVEHLSAALENWAAILTRDAPHATGLDVRLGGGTGASGGLGAGLAAGLGASLVARFEALLGIGLGRVDLDDLIARADLVITAEGAIDYQTPHGKVPAEIAIRAQRVGVPVLGLAGSIGDGAPAVHDIGIAAIASIMTIPMPLQDAVDQGEALLRDAAERTLRLVLLGSSISARQTDRGRHLQSL